MIHEPYLHTDINYMIKFRYRFKLQYQVHLLDIWREMRGMLLNELGQLLTAGFDDL